GYSSSRKQMLRLRGTTYPYVGPRASFIRNFLLVVDSNNMGTSPEDHKPSHFICL
ncbi:hypothetical protein Csa_009763, partial [Cucumis sativus]